MTIFKFSSLALILFLATNARSIDLLSTQGTEETLEISEEISEEAAILPQNQNSLQQKKKTVTCKQTSSVSEKWIKKNYKNCKRCGVFKNHSRKTYYCYCDC